MSDWKHSEPVDLLYHRDATQLSKVACAVLNTLYMASLCIRCYLDMVKCLMLMPTVSNTPRPPGALTPVLHWGVPGTPPRLPTPITFRALKTLYTELQLKTVENRLCESFLRDEVSRFCQNYWMDALGALKFVAQKDGYNPNFTVI